MALLDYEDSQLVGTSEIMDRLMLSVFNSLSTETRLCQFPRIGGLAIYVDDDTLLCTPHTSSDCFTPLIGPRFHISKTIFVPFVDVEDDEKSGEYRESEWSSLIYSNRLLYFRFGKRNRGHIEHSQRPLLLKSCKKWPMCLLMG